MLTYRREIDGLRAIAVLPVLLFHANLGLFTGGFVGVDVFFVISGYLITSIIISEAKAGQFSFISFYERRARRILPVLFLVMLVTTGLACLWMMPDELKNYGQSLLATTLISNNILLSITSGYWDLASDFKPLLHTWSLGVEEQYYLIFPFLFILLWNKFRDKILLVLIATFAASLALSQAAITFAPSLTFFLLPTRAWELALGAITAVYMNKASYSTEPSHKKQILSGFGLLLIAASVIMFTEHTPTPGLYALIPTIGAVLVILFAVKGTVANKLLSVRWLVGVGLISYSLYLWHQPLFAFARIYSQTPPSTWVYTSLIILTFALSYLSWKLVERPARKKSSLGAPVFWSLVAGISITYIGFGLYLNKTYGMASRVFDSSVKIEEMDKRIYNSRVFAYKTDHFASQNKLKILVSGDSFGRDFVNMMTETYAGHGMEIIYRDDLGECVTPNHSNVAEQLFNDADIIVLARLAPTTYCAMGNISFASERHKKIYYIGTKQFGYNLNWLARLNREDLPGQTNKVQQATVISEQQFAQAIPAPHYISFLSSTAAEGRIPITDSAGRMLSTDRSHLTKYGAIYFGEHVLKNSVLGKALQASEIAIN